jgi:hypothetical protein
MKLDLAIAATVLVGLAAASPHLVSRRSSGLQGLFSQEDERSN